MLMTREFDIERWVSNSDGEKVRKIDAPNYIVIYDDCIVNEYTLKRFVNSIECLDGNSCATTNGIVALPINVWQKLHDMIIVNYKMKKR